MELTLIDANFVSLGILDTFKSVIWTDRYFEPGDFDITTYASTKLLTKVALGRYLWYKESDRLMIIEDLWVHSDSEAGNTVILKGRSYESILDRRIVWGQTVYSGSFQGLIQQLLTENAILPGNMSRQIPNLVFEASEDPAITSLTVKAQFTGDNLLKVIQDLCLSAGVGFKVTLAETGEFVFKLYIGTDRSYNQETNPYVVFSPKFDNIVNSDYKLSTRSLKTVVQVAGEGEGYNRIKVAVSSPSGGGTGLNRREMFADAGDISKTIEGGTLTDAEYLEQLTQRGLQVLADNTLTETFEGQVDPSVTYRYNEDFYLGDIVQVANEYGNESSSRVTEVVYCQDSSGIRTYPTFSNIS